MIFRAFWVKARIVTETDNLAPTNSSDFDDGTLLNLSQQERRIILLIVVVTLILANVSTTKLTGILVLPRTDLEEFPRSLTKMIYVAITYQLIFTVIEMAMMLCVPALLNTTVNSLNEASKNKDRQILIRGNYRLCWAVLSMPCLSIWCSQHVVNHFHKDCLFNGLAKIARYKCSSLSTPVVSIGF